MDNLNVHGHIMQNANLKVIRLTNEQKTEIEMVEAQITIEEERLSPVRKELESLKTREIELKEIIRASRLANLNELKNKIARGQV